MARKILCMVIASAFIMTSAAGCGTSTAQPTDAAVTTAAAGSAAVTEAVQEDNSLITLKFFDKNTGDAFDNPVAKEITKKTNVNIEIQQPTGDSTEKLNLMLASDDLPDIVLMDRRSDVVNKYIAAGAIIPLNDLIDKYGPDVTKQYGDVLKKSRYTDGKNYYLNNWYGPDVDPVYGMLMRMDLLKEVAGDKATSGDPFTTDEFTQLLKQVKEKYSQLNNHATIPLALKGDGLTNNVLMTFKGMWGMKKYFEENGTLKYDIKDPKYLDMLKYINQLYRDGLIDKEWAVVKDNLWQQKLSSGYVFATTGSYWDVGTPNTALKKAANGNVESQLYAYKVLAPGVAPDKTTLGGRSSLGWDAIAITKANKYPERTMKFINFLASEEGQYLLMWGVEGTNWSMADGKHKPDETIIDKFQADWTKTCKDTGIRKWTWFIKNGLGSDGTPYDMVTKWKKTEIDAFAMKSLKDTYYDTAEMDDLVPLGGTPEALMAQKIDDVIKLAVAKIITAKSEEDATKLYEKMVADINAAGAEKVEKIISDNYTKRLELWK